MFAYARAYALLVSADFDPCTESISTRAVDPVDATLTRWVGELVERVADRGASGECDRSAIVGQIRRESRV